MTEAELLEPDVVLFLHDAALREYGGLQGVRDENLLHSALGRAAHKLAYADPGTVDLFVLAAAYAFGLASDHPFADGNNRTAWGCCVLFLKLNGIEVVAPVPEVIERMVMLASGQMSEQGFAAWLHSRCVSRP